MVAKYIKNRMLMNILLNSAIVTWILLLAFKLIFNWTFLDYVNIFIKYVFIGGIIIGSIPDFLEKM